MPSKAAIQDAFRTFVERVSHPHSSTQYEQRATRCSDYEHDLFGPYIQYMTDNFHLGRWYVVCHDLHPGSRRPGKTFQYISKPLASADRARVRAYATAHGITLKDKAKGLQFAINNTAQAIAVAQPSLAAIIDLTTSPSPAPSNSSVEITQHVPPPALQDFLVIYFFHEDHSVPKTFKLPARQPSTAFVFHDNVKLLQDVEIKQSDILDVLTSGTSGIESWSLFPVSSLAIPRHVPAIVLSRRRVTSYHDSISALYEHAYPQAAKLPTRIPDPPAAL